MNVLERHALRWRRSYRRGVSPIIAMILLVAITVVLAAVLYVLVSGLTHGVGSAPLPWGWGATTNATSAATSTVGCSSSTVTLHAAPTYCYTVTISPGSGITTSNVLLSLRSGASGATVAWPTLGTTAATTYVAVTVLSPTITGIIAEFCPNAMTTSVVTGLTCTAANTWATASSWPGSFSGGMTLVIAVAGAQATGSTGGLLGTSIEAVGQSGYTGTQASTAFA